MGLLPLLVGAARLETDDPGGDSADDGASGSLLVGNSEAMALLGPVGIHAHRSIPAQGTPKIRPAKHHLPP
jgi:hypothetical protein